MMGRNVSEEFMGLKEDAMPPKRNKQYSPPTTCRTCGLAVNTFREDGSEVLFYPSRPDQCVACIKKRERKGNSKTIETGAVDVPVGSLFKYNCELHGPHNGTKMADRQTPNCPQCYKIKQVDGMRAHNSLVHEISVGLKKYPWLLAWLRDQSEERGVGRYDVLAQTVCDQVPAEWFKKWAMGGAK
jgi:hypothetical protein